MGWWAIMINDLLAITIRRGGWQESLEKEEQNITGLGEAIPCDQKLVNTD